MWSFVKRLGLCDGSQVAKKVWGGFLISGIWPDLGVSENRGSQYSTLNSRILVIRTPRKGTPNFRKLPYGYRVRLEGLGLPLESLRCRGYARVEMWDTS